MQVNLPHLNITLPKPAGGSKLKLELASASSSWQAWWQQVGQGLQQVKAKLAALPHPLHDLLAKLFAKLHPPQG